MIDATITQFVFVRQVFVLRKRATHAVPRPGVRFYIISLSSTTIVYKGQLTSEQVWTYFLDLKVSWRRPAARRVRSRR